MRTRDRIGARRAFVTWLKRMPCRDCGARFDPVCMDFDHVRGEKKAGIKEMVSSGTWEKLAVELAKCELVCANCHRLRTKGRRP